MRGLPELMLENDKAVETFNRMKKQAAIDKARKPHVLKFVGTKAEKFVAGLRFKSGKAMAQAWGIAV